MLYLYDIHDTRDNRSHCDFGSTFAMNQSTDNFPDETLNATILEGPAEMADVPEEIRNESRKHKRRRQLISSLQRISSSPSLARFGRGASSGYRYAGGKGSMSCVSLSTDAFPIDDTGVRSPRAREQHVSPVVLASPHRETVQSVSLARVYSVERDGRASVPLPCEARLGTLAKQSGIPDGVISRSGKKFHFWNGLPQEIRMSILRYLSPKEIIRTLSVSKSWHGMCFDGQLWGCLDTSEYYRNISADTLEHIITSGGPFIQVLNLKGCVQLLQRWNSRRMVGACRNLECFSLEGCRIDRISLHCFLLQNAKLSQINLSGLAGATNSAMKIIGQNCPRLEYLNVSWCNNIDTKGLRRVVDGCPRLRDLRAGETRGWDDVEIMTELFKRNTLERLILMNCESLNDESLTMLIKGEDPEIDFTTGQAQVPPRNLKHLDLTQCRSITDEGIKSLSNHVPDLQGLQLSKCWNVTDDSLTHLLPTLSSLTHLDLEELDELTNTTLQSLIRSPSKKYLSHLGISSCENMGDTGMLPLLRACPRLSSLEMDNTRISDLVLIEAAEVVRERSMNQNNCIAVKGINGQSKNNTHPRIGLRMDVYDCANVTWTGIREVLRSNAAVLPASAPPPPAAPAPMTTQMPAANSTTNDAIITTTTNNITGSDPASSISNTTNVAVPLSPYPYSSPSSSSSSPPPPPQQQQQQQQQQQSVPQFPNQIISLKCFYHWLPTVQEHTKRVLRGDFAAAIRLERKWAEWMMLNEEVGAAAAAAAAAGGAGGVGGRRRRRRAREAAMLYADERAGLGSGDGDEGGIGGSGLGGLVVDSMGRRRRARSGGCGIM